MGIGRDSNKSKSAKELYKVLEEIRKRKHVRLIPYKPSYRYIKSIKENGE